jgi:hypothetical protein
MFLITTDMFFSKAHRRKLIPESHKHKIKLYFDYKTNSSFTHSQFNIKNSALVLMSALPIIGITMGDPASIDPKSP